MRPSLPAVFALVTLALPAGAQDRASTERRLESLRGQIAGVERQVGRARSQEQNAIAALRGIQTEIQLREALVGGYRVQLDTLRRETGALRGSIQQLDGEIASARASYRRYARHAYIRGRTSDLALILSAGSIPQMIARARYLRQFADRRRRQVARIEAKTTELRGRERELQHTLQQTQGLLATRQSEQAALAGRRREREALVGQVRQQRGRLEADLAQHQTDAAALEGLVRTLVAAERRREEEARRVAEEAAARRREEEARAEAARAEAARAEAARAEAARAEAARAEAARAEAARAEAARAEAARSEAAAAEVASATRPAPRPAAPSNTPPPAPTPAAAPARTEPIAPAPAAPVRTAPAAPARTTSAPPAADRPVSLGGTFRGNRGRLPWPADGTVTGRFGTRTDPVHGTRVDSPGIDITTVPGAGVRAVFEGTVEAINVMPTFGTFVMVSHGGYHTFYANLSSVGVQKGQRVRAGQTIGRAGTSDQSRGTGLFFAIFEGERQVDPTPWLR